jgi:two-component SAPR family response regulator
MAMTKRALLGRRYLIVEDEYLIASDLIAVLELAGATVLGPVAHVQHAMEVIVEPDLSLDAAVLDIHLVGETVFGAAELLLIRKIPFIFVTGTNTSILPKQFSYAPCLSKPVLPDDLVKVLSALAP